MKISKNKLLSIIKEEIDNVIREMYRQDRYRLDGDASKEVELLKDIGKNDTFAIVRVIGSGFVEHPVGAIRRIPLQIFNTKYFKKSIEDGTDVNTVNLPDTGESPTDVLRSLGFMSEGLRHHVISKIPLTENVYRVGSTEYFKVIAEARMEYKKGNYTPINEQEKEMLNSDLGEWVMFEGERVPLDFPMYIETLDEKKKKKKKKNPPIGKPMKGSGGKKYQVYVKNKKTGRVKKISYGDSKGGLKGNWNNAEARSNFASRHNCADKKDRTKAGYWACRAHKDFGTNVPGRFW